jgi:hypothetical protein
MHEAEQKKRALIVVRTYPTPARQGVEVSCTAAITDSGEWLRLFPVPWRLLPEDQRFRRYQWIEVGVTKSRDPRPESHKIVPDSIRILRGPLTTDYEWRERKETIFPLRAKSLCQLKRQQVACGYPTLGFFRPNRIEKLKISPCESEWTPAQRDILRQLHLFEERPQQELEKIPYDFQYRFFCDDSECVNGHTLICTDWEIGESWRKWHVGYAEHWEDAFRQKYEEEMINKYDTHFFVGTMHGHPDVWIIVGLFYPPKGTELLIFDQAASS